jgi:hypothetical protein
MPAPAHVGDRVELRNQPWRVVQVQPAAEGHHLVELEALEGTGPRRLTVLAPPDELRALPSERLQLDQAGLQSFPVWARDHRILAATLVRETGLLSGARFGRVTLEAYQFAPALRLLAKPRPRLLVAHDVGHGNTLHAGLSLLELMARGRARRVLVVTPPGLMLQWEEELEEKFGLRFTRIENATGLARVQGDLPAGVSAWDVLTRVLTSMDYLKKETVRQRAMRRPWDLVIVDEAHALALSGTPQNPYSTQRTRLGQALASGTRGLLLLTATPHNGYRHSFRSLIELVEPTAATFAGAPEAVRRRLEAARVRRMKAQIQRVLPDGAREDVFPRRNVEGVQVALDAAARELLDEVASYCSRTARAAAGGEDADLVSFAMQIVKKRALSTRRALEQTVEHRLVALRSEQQREAPPERADLRELQADLPLGEQTAERIARRILRSAIPREEQRRRSELRALNSIRRKLRALPPPDPKIKNLLDQLEGVVAADPPEKVIVFTEYLDTLEALREGLDASPTLAGRYVVLRGGMSIRQRRRVQLEFEKAQTLVMLATDAASEGLNLQHSCHRIVHVELPWNPNRLEQRNGRVDRYGQRHKPEIRYLFYPESPEDDVLARLVTRIEEMRRDRISTPDILGVLAGTGELEKRLVELDPGAADVAVEKQRLVQHFEDRTAEFVRDVQPLMVADGERDPQRLSELLGTNTPLLPDDPGLEALVLGVLGPRAVQAGPHEGTWRLEVPLAYRGPAVSAVYRAVTFHRSVAVRHPAADVEFITPLHPLAHSLATEARRRLAQVYPDERGMPPRRLAARRVPADVPPSMLFTFLGTIAGGGGLLEEHLSTVRLKIDGSEIGAPEVNERLLVDEVGAGDVPWAEVQAKFATDFETAALQAEAIATRQLAERARVLGEHRHAQAEELRRDLEADLADRLREIEAEEHEARVPVDERTGQQNLFGRPTGGTSASVRRAVAESQAASRREEIAEFEHVDLPALPIPLGALFLLPSRAES